MAAITGDVAAEATLRLLDLEEERRHCEQHPAFLLQHVACIDAKTGERFDFQLLRAGESTRDGSAVNWITDDLGYADIRPAKEGVKDWSWQRELLDRWLENDKNLVLKARQIGVTWLSAGLALWTVLYQPGTRVLVVSINLDEAVKVVNRIWDMYTSLPEHLRNGVEVLKPSRGARPSQNIEFQHRDGRVSTILGLPSTKTAGHGETAALVILDEYARHEYARETWKAVFSTADLGGKIIVISTANGVSNELSGEGNFYHHLWVNCDEYGIDSSFLAWDLHPLRNDDWYHKNAAGLPPTDRAEQYPRTPDDAFINTGECWFDLDALAWFAQNAVRRLMYRADFDEVTLRTRKLVKRGRGALRVYEEPISEHEYAIGADVATGRGLDYSAAYIIDLGTMALVAEYHDKIDPDEFATQLHFIGRWFNTARIAVEIGGGYGDAVIIPLRDGRAGRPMYPKLYRHRTSNQPADQMRKNYGFPMTVQTRPLVINQLEAAIRERSLPWMTRELITECRTFCKAKTNPSPRAQDGCNDDRVMAAAITLEMYRLFGVHPDRPRRKSRRRAVEYPWLAA